MPWIAIGGIRPQFRLFYDLHIPGEHPTIGSFFFMQPTNRALVQRSFGLLELQALEGMLPFVSVTILLLTLPSTKKITGHIVQ